MVLKTDFEQIQKICPVERSSLEEKLPLSLDTRRLIIKNEERVTQFKQFLSHLYAERMGINGLSLICDAEIKEFESRLHEWYRDEKLEKAQKQVKMALKSYKEGTSEEEIPSTTCDSVD